MSCVFDILSDIPVAHTISLLAQSGISTFSLDEYVLATPQFRTTLRTILLGLPDRLNIELCTSVVELQRTIRNLTEPRYKFEERWLRFQRSMALDGYRIENGKSCDFNLVVS